MTLCMVFLGLQILFPLTLQAADLPAAQADMITLGVKDPASKPGVHVDFDLPPVALLLLVLPTWLDTPVSVPPHARIVPVPTLLPVAGYHPSAP